MSTAAFRASGRTAEGIDKSTPGTSVAFIDSPPTDRSTYRDRMTVSVLFGHRSDGTDPVRFTHAAWVTLKAAV